MHAKILKIQYLLSEFEIPEQYKLKNRLSINQITEFEEKFNIRFPEKFVDCLLSFSGSFAGDGGIFGLHQEKSILDIGYYFDLFPNWLNAKWIPVASDGCGNYFVCIANSQFEGKDPVVFIDSSLGYDKIAYIVASNLFDFLIFYLEGSLSNTGWPFDSEFVVGIDPDILTFSSLRLPWDQRP
jgi:cell wall assembly regulator SMI1